MNTHTQRHDRTHEKSELLDSLKLNDNQLQAVYHKDGAALILAGAGSGKTTVLTARCAYLMKEHNISPKHILLLTFTKKAAQEMKERMTTLPHISARDTEPLFASTFHSFFLWVLRRIGIKDRILSSDRQKRIMIATILKDNGWDDNKDIETIIEDIAASKRQMLTPDDINDNILKTVYLAYENMKKEAQLLDFDDILYRAYEILTHRPNLLHNLQKRFHYIMIDEFQDTNAIQYELTKLIASPHNNLVVVGDDDQVIYSFNGADRRIIQDFPNHYQARMITLNRNYRSVPSIIELSNNVIKANTQRFHKQLLPVKQDHLEKKPVIYETNTTEDEAKHVIKTIQQLKQSGYAEDDIAILTRTQTNAQTIIEELLLQQMPFQTATNMPLLYDQQALKPVLAHLTLALYPDNMEAINQIIPTFYLKRDTFRNVIDMAQFVEPVSKPLTHLLQSDKLKPYQQKLVEKRLTLLDTIKGMLPVKAIQKIRKEALKNDDSLPQDAMKEWLDGLEDSARRFTSIADFLTFIDQTTATYHQNRHQDGVHLLTIHQAKGLEFPIVFLIGASETLLPHAYALAEDKETRRTEALEEERRLCYVAMTRAKEELYITAPLYYRQKSLKPSRFISNKYKEELIDAWLCENPDCNGWMRCTHSEEETDLTYKHCPICQHKMKKGQKERPLTQKSNPNR